VIKQGEWYTYQCGGLEMEFAKDTIEQCKSEQYVCTLLEQMEKNVDDKLDNLKSFIPVLLAAVAAVIAFLFAYDGMLNEEQSKITMLGLAVMLIAWILLVLALQTKPFYGMRANGKREKGNRAFCINNMMTYYFLPDDTFIEKVAECVGRPLTAVECIKANTVKQKTNEYICRKKLVNGAIYLVVGGAFILAVACLLYVFCSAKEYGSLGV